MTEIESLFWMLSTCLLLVMTWRLMIRMSDLELKAVVSEKMLKRVQQDVIDMGYQLFNLTTQDERGEIGYVYVLKSDSGHYKIGKTINPNNRLATFEVELPIEVHYLVLIKTYNYHRLETLFHHQYRHKRIYGEWFDLTRNDLLFLESFPGNVLKDKVQSNGNGHNK